MIADAATDAAVGGWGAVVAQLGVAAILGWYLWYTTSVSFPKISEMHLSRVDAICSNHDKALNTAMDKFTSEIKEQRATHRDELNFLAQTFSCKGKP